MHNTIKTTIKRTNFGFVPYDQAVKVFIDANDEKHLAESFAYKVMAAIRSLKPNNFSVQDALYYSKPFPELTEHVVNLWDKYIHTMERARQIEELKSIYEFALYTFL